MPLDIPFFPRDITAAIAGPYQDAVPYTSLPNAALYKGKQVRVRPFITGMPYMWVESNGTGWKWIGEADNVVSANAYAPLVAVCPAATFTTLTQEDNGSGKTALVSAGIHSLTDAGSVTTNAYIYVAWTGGTATTGWFKVLATEVNTKKITIELAYTAGLGTAVVTVAGTAIVVATATIPPLLENSRITMEALGGGYTGTGAKTISIKHGAAVVSSIAASTTAVCSRLNSRGGNLNSKAIQIWENACGPHSTSATALVAGTVDTSVSTTMTVNLTMAVANEVMGLYGYIISCSFYSI